MDNRVPFISRNFIKIGRNFELKSRTLTYIKTDLVFDGGALTATTQPDLSDEGNTATLYSGRYANFLANSDYLDLGNVTSAGTVTQVRGWFRSSTHTTVYFGVDASNSVTGTIRADGTWQQVTISLGGDSPTNLQFNALNGTGQTYTMDVAYIELLDASNATLDVFPVWDYAGTHVDGDPCISKSGLVGAYKGTPVGGTGEGIDPDYLGLGEDTNLWFEATETRVSLASAIYTNTVGDYVEIDYLHTDDVSSSISLFGYIPSGVSRLRYLPSSSRFEFYRLGSGAPYYGNISLIVGESYTVRLESYSSTSYKLYVDGIEIVEWDTGALNLAIDLIGGYATFYTGDKILSNFKHFDSSDTLLLHLVGDGSEDSNWEDQVGGNDGTVSGTALTMGDKRATIPQSAGEDWNRLTRFYATYVDFGTVTGVSDSVIRFKIITNSPGGIMFYSSAASSRFIGAWQSGQGTYHSSNFVGSIKVDGITQSTRGDLYTALVDGQEHDVEITITSLTGWNDIMIMGGYATATAFDIDGALIYDLTIDIGDTGTDDHSYLGSPDWTDLIGSNDGTITKGSGLNYLIPESLATSGEDALGNAIASPRLTARDLNLFGDEEHANAGNDVSLDLVGTVEASWEFYLDLSNYDIVLGGELNIFGKQAGGTTAGYGFRVNKNDAYFLCRCGGAYTQTNFTNVITAEKTIFVITVNDGAFNLYANGGLIATHAATTSGELQTTTADLVIGKNERTTAIGKPAVGILSAFKIYSKELTAAEVLQNYDAQKANYGL